MNATSARFVRVAHIVTWWDRATAHEEAVNERLLDLSGFIVVSVDHAANLADTPDGLAHQFSTLITYRGFEDDKESTDE